jgi:competence protein ComEA
MAAESDRPVDPADPLGLTASRAAERPGERVAGLLAELGLSPRTAAIGFAVCLVGLLGWLWLRSPAPPRAEADVPLATVPAAGSAPAPGPSGSEIAAPGGVVLAHAAGAVRRPGLYELAPGDRVADLLAAAGGPTGRADLDRVNLAAPVADGTQIVVPRRGEPLVPTSSGTTGSPADAGSTPVPVDLNTAGPEELDTLPGVGPATAAAILEFRDANGPFASVDALIDVPGIGEAKLAALADLVTV